MSEERLHTIELFMLKCAVIEAGVRDAGGGGDAASRRLYDDFIDARLRPYILQFGEENRSNAAKMSNYYEVFYMLENDIRRLIQETMEEAYGTAWWVPAHVPQSVLEEVKKNRDREDQAALSVRSEQEIDYTTFGQLSDIIKENWPAFAGMLRSQGSVVRVLSSLNMLRGTIAHCGVLADDEIDRLKLSILDWFRVLKGPAS